MVSNIPAILPVVGNIAAAGADFIVLTKNQVMMLYKLAAVYGRDLRDQRTILQDVLPVVGAGLIWRTAARQAATWLPFAAGTIPKLAIAYVGTMAVGRAAEFYYRTGSSRRGRKWFNMRGKPPSYFATRSAWSAARIQEERHSLGGRRGSCVTSRSRNPTNRRSGSRHSAVDPGSLNRPAAGSIDGESPDRAPAGARFA